MEKKKISFLKVFVTILFLIANVGLMVYVILKGDITHNALTFACIGIPFLFSLLFIRFTKKKFLITVALALNFIANYFLIVMPSADNQLIGVCVCCACQLFFLLYSLCLCKGIGLKIINIGFRVALCLLAYFILPKYVVLSTIQLISVMYILNALITLFVLLFNIKKEGLLFIGFLIFLIGDILGILAGGGMEIFGITGAAAEFLAKFEAFYFTVPGLFVIATSSAWEKNK